MNPTTMIAPETRTRWCRYAFLLLCFLVASLFFSIAIMAEMEIPGKSIEPGREMHGRQILQNPITASPGTAEHAAQTFYALLMNNDPRGAFGMTTSRFQRLTNEGAFVSFCQQAIAIRLRGVALPLDGSRTPGAAEFGFGRAWGGGPDLIVNVLQEDDLWRIDSVVLRPNAIQ